MDKKTLITVPESPSTFLGPGENDQHTIALADAIPQIVWTANPDGWLDYYNQYWIDYTGLSIEQTQGWGWDVVLHPDDLQNCIDAWTNAYTTGVPYEIEYRFKRASDGTYRWHLGRALPVRDNQGNIVKWFGTCTDIHDNKEAYAAVEGKVRQGTEDLAAVNKSLMQEIEERKKLSASQERDSIRLNEIITTQGQLAAAELDLDAFMKLVVYRMDALTSASGSAVELVDGDDMVYRAGSGIASAHIGLRLNLHSSISGLCVKSQQALWCVDTHNDDRVDRAACERLGVRSMVVAPLFHNGKAVGVLKSMAAKSHAFGARDMQTLQLMAGLIGNAIAHQISFDAKQRLLNELIAADFERQRSAEELAQQRQLLDTILETIDVGVIACSSEGELTIFNRAAREFHALPVHYMGPDQWVQRGDLYDADNETPLAKGDIPLYRALQGEIVQNAEVVIRTCSSNPRFVLASGRPLIGPQGKNMGAVVAIQDVSELKETQTRLARSEERLRTITDSLPVVITYIDRDERFQFCNATYPKWFGTPADEMMGKAVSEVLDKPLYESRKEFLRRALSGEHVHFEREGTINGVARFTDTVYIPHVRDGVVEGIYTLTTDITSLKDVEKELALLAMSDPLTHLPNRRSFNEKLDEAAKRNRRSGELLGLMYLDIDHFKAINDSLGHAGGDEVLLEFAARIKAAVRVTDMVARLAGDEFTIILQGIQVADEAALVAEKILASIQMPFLARGEPLTVSTSIGIAFLSPDETDLTSLINRADNALYSAKSAGRNRHWMHDHKDLDSQGKANDGAT